MFYIQKELHMRSNRENRAKMELAIRFALTLMMIVVAMSCRILFLGSYQ